MAALVKFSVLLIKRVCRGLILRPEAKTLGEQVNSVPEVKTLPVQVTSKAASGVMTTSEVASGVMNSKAALEAALLVRASRGISRGTLVVKVLRVALQALSKTRVVSDLVKTSVARMISNWEVNKVK